MAVFTAALTTAAMVLTTLSLFGWERTSYCTGKRWEAEVARVGEGLKDVPGFFLPTICTGSRIRWSFKGSFHE